jgi:hypothetical protein
VERGINEELVKGGVVEKVERGILREISGGIVKGGGRGLHGKV